MSRRNGAVCYPDTDHPRRRALVCNDTKTKRRQPVLCGGCRVLGTAKFHLEGDPACGGAGKETKTFTVGVTTQEPFYGVYLNAAISRVHSQNDAWSLAGTGSAANLPSAGLNTDDCSPLYKRFWGSSFAHLKKGFTVPASLKVKGINSFKAGRDLAITECLQLGEIIGINQAAIGRVFRHGTSRDCNGTNYYGGEAYPLVCTDKRFETKAGTWRLAIDIEGWCNSRVAMQSYFGLDTSSDTAFSCNDPRDGSWKQLFDRVIGCNAAQRDVTGTYTSNTWHWDDNAPGNPNGDYRVIHLEVGRLDETANAGCEFVLKDVRFEKVG